MKNIKFEDIEVEKIGERPACDLSTKQHIKQRTKNRTNINSRDLIAREFRSENGEIIHRDIGICIGPVNRGHGLLVAFFIGGELQRARVIPVWSLVLKTSQFTYKKISHGFHTTDYDTLRRIATFINK